MEYDSSQVIEEYRQFTMLTRRSYSIWLAIMLLVVFSFSFMGWQRCDGCLAHDAGESLCIECVYDTPIYIHEQKSGVELCSAEPHVSLIASDQDGPADGYPAGIFRPPTTLL
jgi:hypothetical protein